MKLITFPTTMTSHEKQNLKKNIQFIKLVCPGIAKNVFCETCRIVCLTLRFVIKIEWQFLHVFLFFFCENILTQNMGHDR